MRKNTLLFVIAMLVLSIAQAQQNRFNEELDKFCKTTITEFGTINKDRKAVLDGMAQQLAAKKYVVFTCKTNSRRTLMLQVWAQTSFYYYGLLGKYAFSIGDTVTDVYPGVADVLVQSGFYCTNLKNDRGYNIAYNKEYPENILSSKNEVGTLDTAKGLIANICFEDEPTGSAARKTQINLPYQSPTVFEKTEQEKQKYTELNHQIALEMLYLGFKTRDIIIATENAKY